MLTASERDTAATQQARRGQEMEAQPLQKKKKKKKHFWNLLEISQETSDWVQAEVELRAQPAETCEWCIQRDKRLSRIKVVWCDHSAPPGWGDEGRAREKKNKWEAPEFLVPS